jgi:hypothetical protein
MTGREGEWHRFENTGQRKYYHRQARINITQSGVYEGRLLIWSLDGMTLNVLKVMNI